MDCVETCFDAGAVFFLEQVEGTGNACGTVACIHAVGNAVAGQAFHVPWETPLGKYITEASKDHTPKERGNRLLAATDLHQAADDTARSGQTEGAGTDDAGDRHFVCFCERGGRLFELDGRNIGVDDEAFHSFIHSCTQTRVFDCWKFERDDDAGLTDSYDFFAIPQWPDALGRVHRRGR